MKIAIGSDSSGAELKDIVVAHLVEAGHEVTDVGWDGTGEAEYSAHYARQVAHLIRDEEAERGVLICGTGIGMSIAANKVDGIRAALCGDCFSAEFTRRHNDANILTLGARVVGPGLALKIVDTYLDTAFEGGRHARRIAKIADIEKRG